MFNNEHREEIALNSNLFEKEWPQSVRVFQTLLQLPEKEPERDRNKREK